MKLTNTYEKNSRLEGYQEIIITSKDVFSREEAAELGYDDFTADLYIDKKYVGDISPVLSKSGAWEAMIDETNWEEMYYSLKHENAA